MAQTKTYRDAFATRGRSTMLVPAGTQAANHANSTSPSSASLSNSTPGYTTLGGRYQFAAVGSAATDFTLFGFTVPTGSTLYVTGVTISTLNTGAAVATTATILDWSVAVSTSADLGAASGATAKRLPLGTQGFIVAAAIGAAAPDVVRVFDPPLVVASASIFHVIVQCPVGTATGSQVSAATCRSTAGSNDDHQRP
jgi:hypothetical protein